MRTALILTGLLLAAPAAAQDVEAGAELAAENCTRCHDIAPGGAFKEYPPSFAAIAVYRSAEQIESRIWFPPTHTSMPQMSHILSPETVDDLVAYIVSLEES